MKLMVISLYILIIIFLIGSVRSFDFNYPSSVSINETFKVSVESNTTGNYDIKIVVQDNNKKILSKIDNDGWKNPFYYSKGSYPNRVDYDNEVVSGAGENDICVRMRPTGKSSYEELCKKINIDQSEVSETVSSDVRENPSSEESNLINHSEKIDQKVETNFTVNDATNNKENNISNEKVEKIILNPDVILNSNGNADFIAKKGKIGKWIFYSFLFFCAAIIILIFIKRI